MNETGYTSNANPQKRSSSSLINDSNSGKVAKRIYPEEIEIEVDDERGALMGVPLKRSSNPSKELPD